MAGTWLPYARVTSGNVQTVLDATAQNPVGALWGPPVPAGSPLSTVGLGAQPVYKYVYYNSTSNPAPVAAPAPVYYTDESFTTVSGNAAEAFYTTSGACIAGYLMPNSTAVSGLTNAELNESYCFIQVGGLLKGAYAPTTATGAGQGVPIYGVSTSTNWGSTTVAPTGGRVLGIQWTAIASSACDVLVGGATTFWGS